MSASVIIPTYNRADLLARCLRSLVAAAVPDLDIIVVDDGGTDNSAEVVGTFPGVRYFRQQNAGPATARNVGARASKGGYLAFIDSDDEWINGGIRRLVTQLDANPDVAVVFADTSMGNEDTGFESFVRTYGGDLFYDLPHEQRDGLRVFERRPFLKQLSTRNVMFLGSMLFRREAFEALSGFDGSLCGAADWDLFMRATASDAVAFSEGPAISRYYKHAAAMSTDTEHMEEDFIKALESVHTRCDLDADERVHIEERLREHIFGWAYLAYSRGDFRTARRRLRRERLQGKTMRLREKAYLMATYLPPSVVGAMRKARQSLGV
jgi:glycosyltransferase involved in cell wall biosynthesis